MNEEANNKDPWEKYLWLGFFIVLLVWIVYWIAVLAGLAATESSFNRFDPLNTLFSGLAFWGIVFTVLLQKKELMLQRTELQLTRLEVEGQKKQLAAQNATMGQQRFEITLFSLLNLLADVIASMEVRITQTYNQRACFPIYRWKLQQTYNDRKNFDPIPTHSSLCREVYWLFKDKMGDGIESYFQILRYIVTFIDRSNIEDKHFYVDLVRVQLSKSEKILLFYRCLANDAEGFKILVERYGLLSELLSEDLFDKMDKELYARSAFQK
ncbi:MAG: hypothetical protein KIS97_06725 [Nitrospira sp.]|nr:hypothetical protein [Nitrospira sp.]